VISAELLEVLACPRCHGKLEPNLEANTLDCPQDRLRFKVEDGIPVMLLDEATAY